MPPPVVAGAVGAVVVARAGQAMRTSVATKLIRWLIQSPLRRRYRRRDRSRNARMKATKQLQTRSAGHLPLLLRARVVDSNWLAYNRPISVVRFQPHRVPRTTGSGPGG